MNDDDEEVQNISLAIRKALENLLPTTEVDGRAMGRWLQSEFAWYQLEELVIHVERHCREMGRACR